MALITDTEALRAFCQQLAGSPYVTVDTEFMRERTFWPKLCLVQVAGPDAAAAIDPLAEGMDLAPLLDLLAAPETVKVFHAARQDLEIFLQLMGCMPAPVFDTQVAAMVCGFGDQVGYETLVARLTKAHVDKASRFTDWSIRPLSERQIDYALSDVTHLRRIYERLRQRIEAEGRGAWLDEEMATLTDPAIYEIDPMDAWQRIKCRSSNPRFLAVLREVAAWRERLARDKDVPRNRILRDEALMEIAHHHPRTVEDLARTRGLGRGLAEGSGGAAVLEAVARGMAVPESECPQPPARRDVPNRFGATVELLKVLLRVQCDAHAVAQRLVASSADIEAIAVDGEAAAVPALHGWRREVFGNAALELRAGRLALAVNGRHLALIPLAGDDGDEVGTAAVPGG
jgi:ribonuclease D